MARRSQQLALCVSLCGAAVVAGGCRCGKPPHRRVQVRQGRLLGELGESVITGAQGPGGLFAAGTSRGGVILLRDGKATHLLRDIGARRAAGPAVPAAQRPDHDGPISALAFSADGRHLLSTGGHSAIWWDVQRGQLVRQVRGPHDLTAAVVTPDGKAALFATHQGHVLRWRFERSDAEGIDNFACRAHLVPPERQRLDPDKRCPVGHYALVDDKPLCFYAVTQMARRQQLVARACREGTVGVLDLRTRGIRWSSVAGALEALAFVDADHLLFARTDGELRLWSSAAAQIVRSFQPPVKADAAAGGAGLIAVAQRDRIRIWLRDQTAVAAAVKVPRRVVWLQINERPLELQALLEDGRLISHGLAL